MKIKLRCVFVLLALAAGIASCSQQPKSKPVAKTVKPTVSVIQDSAKKVIIAEPGLRKLVDELNMRLDLYDSIAAMQNYTKAELTKFKLSVADRDSLIAQNDGDISGYSLAATYQFIIDDLLKVVLNHPAIKNYQLGDILHIETVTSDDKKVFNLILPENTGGTYQSNLSWIQYRPDDGKIYNYYPEHLLSEKDSISKPAFNIDGFSTITAIHTKKGTKYIFQGSIAGCTTCIGDYIQLGYFSKGQAIEDFSYTLHTKSGADEGTTIDYDAKKQTISVEHTPGDAEEEECDCNTDENGENNSESNNILTGSSKAVYHLKSGKKLICIFKFNGDTFVLDTKRSRLPQ